MSFTIVQGIFAPMKYVLFYSRYFVSISTISRIVISTSMQGWINA